MGKVIVTLACLGVIAFSLCAKVWAGEIEWEDLSAGMQDFKSVIIHPDNPEIIYAALKRGVFKSEDRGRNYRSLFFTKGQNRKANFLLFGPQDTNSLYAATTYGLFYSNNQGRSWQRIFRGKNPLEDDCTAIVVLSNTIYLGTSQGLFASKDKGHSWKKQAGQLGKSPILAIACNLKEAGYIYVVCKEAVFKTEDGGESWQKIFVVQAVENDDPPEENNEEHDEEERPSHINYIIIDPNDSNYVYLSASKGVYRSQDRGANWQLLSGYGLLDRNIKYLLIDRNSRLYAASHSALFEYREGRWQELTFSLNTQGIGLPALDNQNNLYLPCDNGLFKGKTGRDEFIRMAALYYKEEPAINEVQQAAIQYAEVEPEKIKLWRRQAAKKALFPKASTTIGRDATDLWHWESGSTTKTGDDILLKGRDSVDWSVSLSWDLGELIWNDAQASIDARSRLMVELRGNILDEVTKLYFERLRVKMEIDSLPIEERKKIREKKLKLDELTASLDALTGGYFSCQLRPEASPSSQLEWLVPSK